MSDKETERSKYKPVALIRNTLPPSFVDKTERCFAQDVFTWEQAHDFALEECDRIYEMGDRAYKLPNDSKERKYWVFFQTFIAEEGADLAPQEPHKTLPDNYEELEPNSVILDQETRNVAFSKDLYSEDAAILKAKALYAGSDETQVIATAWYCPRDLDMSNPQEAEFAKAFAQQTAMEKAEEGEGREYWLVQTLSDAELAAWLLEVKEMDSRLYIESTADVPLTPLAIPFTLNRKQDGELHSENARFRLPFNIVADSDEKPLVRFIEMFELQDEVLIKLSPLVLSMFVETLDDAMAAEINGDICAQIFNLSGSKEKRILKFAVQGATVEPLLEDGLTEDDYEIYEYTRSDGIVQYFVTVEMEFNSERPSTPPPPPESGDGDGDGDHALTAQQEVLENLLAQRMAMQRLGVSGTEDEDGGLPAQEDSKEYS